MRTLENSLRCLAHPVSLLCIALLILNDHFFKTNSPSWLTGKLSDFAGLFFFPFLLALCFEIVFQRASQKTIGALAIGVTAIWFVLIKATALGNALTEEMLARLLGLPVQIVLDPTDLIALPVLIPAWRLWNRAEAPRPTRLSWIALGVASLAVMATSPCPTNARIDRIVDADGILYYHYSTIVAYPGPTAWWGDNYYVFSTDGGRSWKYIYDYATNTYRNVPSAVKSPVKLPIVECSRQDPKKCYRIAAQDRVEESDNSGQTWRIAWQIPPGRRYFMQRLGENSWCWRAVDPGPYDLILPAVSEYTVIVAMGTEQFLVRNREGSWRQKSPFEYPSHSPLPFYASNLGEAFSVVAREADLTVLFALFGLWLLSFRSAQILKNVLPQRQPSAFRRVLPLLFLFLLVCVAVGIWYTSNLFLLGSLTVLLPGLVLIPTLSLVCLLVTWRPMARSAASPSQVWQIAKRVAWVALLTALLVTGIFLLWAFGVIAEYAIAAFLALSVSIALLIYGYRGVEVWARKCV